MRLPISSSTRFHHDMSSSHKIDDKNEKRRLNLSTLAVGIVKSLNATDLTDNSSINNDISQTQKSDTTTINSPSSFQYLNHPFNNRFLELSKQHSDSAASTVPCDSWLTANKQAAPPKSSDIPSYFPSLNINGDNINEWHYSTIPALGEKLALYNEYRHYGHNPENVQAMLTELEAVLLNEKIKGMNDAEQIKALLPALKLLACEMLTPEMREKLTAEQLAKVNKREDIARELIGSFVMLPEILLKTNPKEATLVRIANKEALTDELVGSSLKRLLSGSESEQECQALSAEIRIIIQTCSSEMRKRIDYFFASSNAKLQKPVQKELTDKLQQVNYVVKAAQNYLKKTNCLASTDFNHSVLRICTELDRFQHELKIRINSMSYFCKNIENPSGTRDKWWYSSGVRVSVPSNNFLRAIEKAYKSGEIKWSKLKNKLDKWAVSKPLVSFSTLSQDDKTRCLELKKMAMPVQDNVVELQKAVAQFQQAIQDAKRDNVTALLGSDTAEKALFTELTVLTEDSPLAKLILAIQTAKTVAQKILNAPSVVKVSVSSGSEISQRGVIFSLFIQETSDTLESVARSLRDTAKLAEYNFRQQTITSTLDNAKTRAKGIQNVLDNALESIVGVQIYGDFEWIDAKRIEIKKNWQGIINPIKKDYKPYPCIKNKEEQSAKERAFYNQLHQSVLPVLNETEKLRITARQLEMALISSEKDINQRQHMVDVAVKRGRDIDLNGIRHLQKLIDQTFSKHDIPIYQKGDEYGGKPATLRILLNKLIGELLTTGQILQEASWLAAWVPDGEKVRLTLIEIKSELESIKAGIKDVVEAGTGSRLDNNSLEGMIAKDAGAWLAALKKEWLAIESEMSTKEADKLMNDIIHSLSQEFITEDDPEGKLFSRRTELAIKDAEKENIPWPLTAEEYLASTKTPKEYRQAWAEKNLMYGMLYNCLIHYTPVAMLSIQKKMVTSPLRLLKLLMTPVRMEITQRAMAKVKPGHARSAALITEYNSRERYQAGFRLLSMLSPQLPKTLAAVGIVADGLAEGGEYRDNFLKRAVSRLPGDLFWLGGFAVWENVGLPEKLMQSSVPIESINQAVVVQQRVQNNKVLEEIDPSMVTKKRSKRTALDQYSDGGVYIDDTNDIELVFFPQTFNNAMNAWLKDKGSSVEDEEIAAYIKIFSSVPIDADLNQLRMGLDEHLPSQVSYIFTLVNRLEANSCPIDFIALKKEAEREMEIVSKRELAQKKNNILNELVHPDNPNLPLLLKRDFLQLATLYSEQQRNITDLEQQEDHRKALEQNSSLNNQKGPVIERLFNKERVNTDKKISSLNQLIKEQQRKMEAIEQAKQLEHLVVVPRQVDLDAKIANVTFKQNPTQDIVLKKINQDAKQNLDQLILAQLQKKGFNTVKTNLDQRCKVYFIQGTAFPAGVGQQVSFVKDERLFSLRQILLGEADRSIFIDQGGSQRISSISCEQNDATNFVHSEDNRLAIADGVMSGIKRTLEQLANDQVLQEHFKAIVFGKMVDALNNVAGEKLQQGSFYHHIMNGFLDGTVQPEPVEFKGKVVPNIFSIGRGDYRIMISVKTSEVLFVNTMMFNSELPHFIKNHLPLIKQGGFVDDDVQPIKHEDNRLAQKWSHRLLEIKANLNIAHEKNRY